MNYGADGTPVTAVPDAGYHFVSWSDGVLTAARTDTNVTADMNVTANVRDQHLHADLHGRSERLDHGHDAADGELRRRRHAGHGDAGHRLPLRELERRLPDGRAHGHERDGGRERDGELRDQYLHADLHGGSERFDHRARRRRR